MEKIGINDIILDEVELLSDEQPETASEQTFELDSGKSAIGAYAVFQL